MKEHDADETSEPGWLMSTLADGEVDDATLDRGCRLWAVQTSARERWHAYHLIGDALRSQDLVSAPQRDRDFMQRLSARLDLEPAVLSPAPMPAPIALTGSSSLPPRRRWGVPAALAAGVMALGVAFGLWPNIDDRGGAAPTLAAVPAHVAPTPAATPASTTPMLAAAPPSADPVATGGQVIRDARLDRYLRAHRDYAAALPGSLPGGSGRSVAPVAFER